MSDSDAALILSGVSKHYDGGLIKALDRVDLRVDRGEWIALTGPSGCGKSTLLHILATLDRPTSGTGTVLGHDLTRLRDSARFRRDHIGLVFQLHNLLPQLTTQQNVEVALLGTRVRRRERAVRATRLLGDVDLTGRAGRYPAQLSGGERQRVAIARALVNNPPLLLADEPTGSLDTAAAHRIIDLFRRLREADAERTIVMVTHAPDVAAAADRIVEMRDGRTVPSAPPVDRSAPEVVRRLDRR